MYRTILWPLRARYADLTAKDRTLFSALMSLTWTLQASYSEVTAMDRAIGQLRTFLRRQRGRSARAWCAGMAGRSAAAAHRRSERSDQRHPADRLRPARPVVAGPSPG